MKKINFEKIRKNCPWLHQPYEYEPKVCRAAWACQYNDGNIQGVAGSKFNGWNEMYCSEENCAVLYWLKSIFE